CRNEEALRSLEELDAVLRSHECLLTAPASSLFDARNSGRPSRNVHQRCQQFSRNLHFHLWYPRRACPSRRRQQAQTQHSCDGLRRTRLSGKSERRSVVRPAATAASVAAASTLEFEDATRDEEDIDSDIETAVPSCLAEILNLFNKQNVLSQSEEAFKSPSSLRTANPAGRWPAGPQQGGQQQQQRFILQQHSSQQLSPASPAVPPQAPQKLEYRPAASASSDTSPPPTPPQQKQQQQQQQYLWYTEKELVAEEDEDQTY
uniref:Rhoa gtpase effector dia/diaphanous n=1 Tax=Macrostomum lignano TaxID=282301 RepID=A0A1I8JPM6_9PLAT